MNKPIKKEVGMKNVSKEIFLNAIVCPTLGWLMRSGEITKYISEPSLGEKFRLEQGFEVHKKARELYPEGNLLSDVSIELAANKTKIAMVDPKTPVVLEGTFLYDCFAAKADILKRKGRSWHMIEVKSNVNDKKEFLDDMAYTATIITCCGVNISTVSLLLISKEYRLGMGIEKLFKEVDHTDEVLDKIKIFESSLKLIKKITSALKKPKPEISFECRKCKIFKDCLGKVIENHIFDIPRLTQTKFEQLKTSNINCIDNIPDEFALTANQQRVRNCVIKNEPFIDDKLADELRIVQWPAYYLDFETVMTALPLYPNIAPYTQLPTQYSIHKCSELKHIIDHFDYLADPSSDCRREIAEGLIKNLRAKGNIIVYSNFEKNIVNQLTKLFPDISSGLKLLVDRMVDLEAIIRKNFYHPQFHGSTSLKNILPVLVPEISYDNLEIKGGDSATATFAYWALGKYKTHEIQRIRKNLKAYCKQDTLAMIRLHQKLAEYVR